MIDLSARMKAIGSATAAMICADAPLYLVIVVYTIVGLALLDWAGDPAQAAYWVYVSRWLLIFAISLPAVALLTDLSFMIYRFDRRRTLAARHVFSHRRVARLLSGIVLLQAMVLFQGTFTSVKNVLSVWQGGFPYDRIQADIDKALHFGIDPWRLLYAFAEHDWIRIAVEWNYTVVFFALCFGTLFYVATAPRAEAIRQRYLLAFMLVWIIVGNLLAGAFMSAGPAFYGFVTGDEARFAGQLEFLARDLEWPNSAARIQEKLWGLHAAGQAGFGSGISAFPSVHVGLAMLNALFLADYDRRLGLAGFAYVVLIVASSVYLGWHYAIDGYVAIAVVLVIHFALKRIVLPRSFVEVMPAAAEPPRAITAS